MINTKICTVPLNNELYLQEDTKPQETATLVIGEITSKLEIK